MTPRDQLEARLAAAKAEHATLAAARDERDQLAQLEARVEAEERAIADERALAAAVAEHGPVGRKVAAVPTGLGVVIVKRPNAVHFRQFQDEGSTKTAALEKLVRRCLVYPPVPAFEALLEEQPGVLVRVANAVAILADTRAEEVSGK